MSDGELAEEIKCDYCDEPAVLKFRLMRLVRYKRRWFKEHSGQWMAGCAKHWRKAEEQANAGLRR